MNKKTLSSGGIIANYRCPAACGHCLYGSSPTAEPGYITEETAFRICLKLRSLGCSGVHIGGGEPFLNVKGLVGLIKAILSSGLELDYIETNAAWITGKFERDKAVLEEVIEAGDEIATIMVSADPFHVAFVPFWKNITLINMLQEIGASYFVWQQRYLPILSKLDKTKTYTPDELKQALGYDAIAECAKEYGMSFNGRALNIVRKTAARKPVEHFLSGKPCREILNSNHFHVDFLEIYVPPSCTGMGVLIEDIDKPLDSGKYPVVSELCSNGLEGLYNFAVTEGFVPSSEGYASKCDVCFSARKYLATEKPGRCGDLTPNGFYLQDY